MFSEYVLTPFLDAIGKFPMENSFLINDKFYTYKEFALNISGIRNALQSTNIRSRNIGLVVNDDIQTYAAIFAVWMEGLAYVPLHPIQPVDRSLEIISQAEIFLVIDSSPETIFTGVSVINSTTLEFGNFNLQPKLTRDEDLAYILFTSGSTGKPKGVQITRKNVGAFMKSFWSTGIQIDENDRCLQCFDLTFDVSVQSFLVPLTKGACTYTIPHNQIKYSYVYGLLEDYQLTFGAMAPSMIRYLRPYFDEINIPAMRYNILTAEASPVDLIIEWSKCIPNAEIIDFYGPTEATIYCTYNKFSRNGNNKQLNGMLSIGKPMNGLKAIIIDEEKHILTSNDKGELCISGDQLTSGYWKNPEKNKESFFEIETDGIVERFYKTGDSCYFDDEGDIMLAGRLDYQVKIQGYRIELGEIEYHAREFLNGQNAVAISYSNKIGNSEIALFIEGPITSEAALVKYLNNKMPYYMIPSQIIIESIFALNTSGKVDRICLKNQLIN
jgi:D-alanine--poly(phosphoribitol) ligase subunit 1